MSFCTVARRRLVIPGEVTGIGMQRHNGSGEQGVHRCSADQPQIVRSRIGRAEVDGVDGPDGIDVP
jgi:hypothetical protein